MPGPDLHEFVVDLDKRTVSHPCGVCWTYHEFKDHADWSLTLGSAWGAEVISAEQLRENFEMAKLAALRAGMQSTLPLRV